MAQAVVDPLEAIQVQEEHRDLAHVARRQHDRLADPVVQQHSIWETGQKVMVG